MSAATEDYFSEQNVFAHWLDQNCRVEPANIYLFSTAREIYQNWKAFAEANGEHAGSSKGLGARLARIGLRSDRRIIGKRVRGWVGIELFAAKRTDSPVF